MIFTNAFTLETHKRTRMKNHCEIRSRDWSGTGTTTLSCSRMQVYSANRKHLQQRTPQSDDNLTLRHFKGGFRGQMKKAYGKWEKILVEVCRISKRIEMLPQGALHAL